MKFPRVEYFDTITLSDGSIIKRYKHYFSGKMEIIEEYVYRATKTMTP
jgi:hypothetical protein